MKRLAILGANGHGKVIADAALLQGWDDVAFYDDAWPAIDSNGRWSVVGNTEDLLNARGRYAGVVVGIGDNRIRQGKLELLKDCGFQLASVVHPSACVSSFAEVGAGAVVFANATINADARVGGGTIINTGAVIEHDCVLGNCVHVSPNAVMAGGSTAGDRVWLGAGAVIKQLVDVGTGAIVGMGAVVIRDVPSGMTVVGNPARAI
jgi:sugar O-acyltransferase (sialic acid O-acetyltransferase NeuD family)